MAITSPDPDLNSDAREYFTRHMRILERVMAAWPMPDMQKQIDAVREAFSADTSKPFVLKQSFPYGSPRSSNHSSPPRGEAAEFRQQGLIRTGSFDQRLDTQVSFSAHPITPPISAGPVDSKGDSPGVQSLVMMPPAQVTQATGMPLTDAPSWNPSRIFE